MVVWSPKGLRVESRNRESGGGGIRTSASSVEPWSGARPPERLTPVASLPYSLTPVRYSLSSSLIPHSSFLFSACAAKHGRAESHPCRSPPFRHPLSKSVEPEWS